MMATTMFTSCKKEEVKPKDTNNPPTNPAPPVATNSMSGTYTLDGNTVLNLNDDNFTAFAMNVGTPSITITSSTIINGKTYDFSISVSNYQLQNGLAGFVGKYEYSLQNGEIPESATAGRVVSSDLKISNGEDNDPNEKFYSVMGGDNGKYNVLNITESSANGIKGNFEGVIKDGNNNSVKIVLNFNSIPPKFSTYGF